MTSACEEATMLDYASGGLQPHIRHITSIHVRNLSPFPARDVAASALSLPAERSQFTSLGQLADDSDVALSRRRSRKVSVNSVNSTITLKSDAGGEAIVLNGSLNEARGRKAKALRLESPAGSVSGGMDFESPPRHKNTSGSAPTIRPRRPRTTSTMSNSSISITLPGPVSASAIFPLSSSGPLSAMLPDHSQVGLEKVIHSRLVETFIAVTVSPSHTTQEASVPSTPIASSSRPSTPLSSPPIKGRARSMSKLPNGIHTKKDTKATQAVTSRPTDFASSPRSSPKHPSFSPSPIQTNGKATPSVHHKSSSSIIRHVPATPSAPVVTVPNFISDVHRPSTNPLFYLDRLADWTDMSANKLNIQIWAKIGDPQFTSSAIGIDGKGKGKGKERQLAEAESESDWKILQEWDINLYDLVPLPSELSENSGLLPPNTLVFRLSPPDRYFYIPSPYSKCERSSSPSLAYNSDPEHEVRKLKQDIDIAADYSDPLPHLETDAIPHPQRRHRKAPGRADDCVDELAKTASWQDLFKLVSLQSTLADTELSLNEIMANVDKSMEPTEMVIKLKREVSEREVWVASLKESSIHLKTKSDELRERILTRRTVLEARRNILALARAQLKDDIVAYSDSAMEVTEEEHHLVSLHAQLQPLRTSLISTLASIFPIDLLSPPDLLYTILDVPLPIPLTNTDPAPPLTLPNHKDINEDVVATSLGYSAQVVQLLAAYLGKELVYPITYVGSRSLVRDGISGMVGPRMFPLFSRGVDTYRFEYGVFLLNKDIEMLMGDRDLRPVDMRHTLPNLKNLLLTLTSGEEPIVRNIHRPPSSVLSISSLESPRPESPQLPDIDSTSNGGTTPKASKPAELPPEHTTPPASGATTPTTSTPLDAEKKARPSYLSLAPFSSFLRSRLPSSTLSKPTVKEIFDGEPPPRKNVDEGVVPVVGGQSTSSSGNHEPPSDTGRDDNDHDEQRPDEEDRKTIRGVPVGLGFDHAVSQGLTKDSLVAGLTEPRNEKADDLIPLDAPPTPQLPPQPV